MLAQDNCKADRAQATPKRDRSQGATSAVLFALGLQLMSKSVNSASAVGRITKEDALTYRDGLIIALLAAVPLRRRTLAALTIDQHLVKIGTHWLLDIPAADTKTCRALEFPVPHALFECIDLYLADFPRRDLGCKHAPGTLAVGKRSSHEWRSNLRRGSSSNHRSRLSRQSASLPKCRGLFLSPIQ